MTTEQQIEKELNDEFVKFSNGIYDGKVEIPKNILEIFKEGIMVLPPFSHKINFIKVKNIAAKKVSELTYADLNDVIKVVLNTSLNLSFDSFHEGVKHSIAMDKFVMAYNETISKFQDKLRMRRTTLQNLSSPKMNRGLQIIN